MSDAFCDLCAEVERATAFLHELDKCRPHYQRVLDYINAHPEERDEMAAALSGSFYGRPGAARASVYMLQFLMQSLKWPEVRVAAEERWNDGGNHFYDCEMKSLLAIYGIE
ncbi:MAG TPA: hypothetical protein VI454_00170 [Verrucomicrobiae bacterium]|jgi:hypothetical protein